MINLHLQITNRLQILLHQVTLALLLLLVRHLLQLIQFPLHSPQQLILLTDQHHIRSPLLLQSQLQNHYCTFSSRTIAISRCNSRTSPRTSLRNIDRYSPSTFKVARCIAVLLNFESAKFFLNASKRICSLNDPGNGVATEGELNEEAEKDRCPNLPPGERKLRLGEN